MQQTKISNFTTPIRSQILRLYFVCSQISKKWIVRYKHLMIKAFSNDFGSDIFYTNTNGYLIHQWSRSPNKGTFYYRVLTEKMIGQPAIIHSQDVTYVYFLSPEKRLRRVKVNLNNLYDKPKVQITQDVMGCINPVCCSIGDQLSVCYIDGSGRLVEVRQSKNNQKENKSRFINEKKMAKTMLKLIKTQKGEPFLFYKNIRHLYWTTLQTKTEKQILKKIELPFRIQQNQRYQMVEKDEKIYLFAVTDERKICEIVFNLETEEVLYSGQISNEIILEKYPINIESNDRDITIWFATSETKIISCSKNIRQNDQKWDCSLFRVEKPLGTGLYIGDVNGKFKLLTLDKNQVLSSFSLPHYNSSEFQEEVSQPYIIWEQIKEQCNPIGEGYWTNVYHHPQLNVAIKKFKKKKHEFWHKVTEEILALKKLEKIQPQAFGARLFEKGVLIGFSQPYHKVNSWHQMVKNKNSHINLSPVARVKLIIGLAKQVRQIQSIDLCHGDIHLGNILMKVDQEKGTVVDPEIWIKVIDFGNAFSMESGKLVSMKGLTGARNLIPPEIRALNENNYNPYGYNPYQLLVNSLMILLKQKTFTCEFTAENNISRLEKNDDYPQELKDWLRQLMHHRISRRNDALNRDISHFQELTRQIYLLRQVRKASTQKRVLNSVAKNRSTTVRVQKMERQFAQKLPRLPKTTIKRSEIRTNKNKTQNEQ